MGNIVLLSLYFYGLYMIICIKFVIGNHATTLITVSNYKLMKTKLFYKQIKKNK